MRMLLEHFFVGIVGLLSVIYLINPTAGIIEFIPDNIPLVGNVDEVLAATLLISALRHFGIDLSNMFQHKKIK